MGLETGFFLGVIVLFAALVIGLVQYARRDRRNIPVTEEATRELYKHPDTFDQVRPEFEARTRR